MGGESLTGRTLGGKYRLIRQIGKGGMGSVYEGVHNELEKRVAVKLLHQQMAPNEDIFLRFKREAKIACRLNHPNIIEVFDFDRTPDGIPYIVMELLTGEDLEVLLERQGRLSLERVLAIFEGICSAVHHAHGAGVIHRDLKPQNILLCTVGDRTEVPKVLDFGISKLKDNNSIITQTQAYLGTPCFMAPEQARGKAADVTAHSDIFALGAILYRMLSGRLAFSGASIEAVLYKVIHEQPEPLQRACPELPSAVARVVHRALAKDPDLRHMSVKGMYAALVAAARETGAVKQTPELLVIKEHTAVHPPVVVLGAADQKRPRRTTTREFGGGESMAALGSQPATPMSMESPSLPRGVSDSTMSASMGEQFERMVRPKRAPWIFGGVALAVLLAVGLVFGLPHLLPRGQDDGSPQPRAPRAATPAPLDLPPPAPAPVKPARITVELLNLPAGAKVSLDGEAVTENPFSLERADKKRRLQVATPDGRSFAHELTPNRDLTLAVVMPPAPAIKPGIRRPPRRKPTPTPTPAEPATKPKAKQKKYGEGTMPMELE